jgi:hypothetical protein
MRGPARRALLAVWCTVTTPSPAMSPSTTRATPSGSDSSAATSATERVCSHSSATARCSTCNVAACARPRGLVDTNVSIARSNPDFVRPRVHVYGRTAAAALAAS